MSKISRDILSDITVHMKYAKYIPEKKQKRNLGRTSNKKYGDAY